MSVLDLNVDLLNDVRQKASLGIANNSDAVLLITEIDRLCGSPSEAERLAKVKQDAEEAALRAEEARASFNAAVVAAEEAARIARDASARCVAEAEAKESAKRLAVEKEAADAAAAEKLAADKKAVADSLLSQIVGAPVE